MCIPTYDRLSYLKEAVSSAQAQSLQDIEILVSDDGTSQPLRAWVEDAARRDPRIRYRRNQVNLGLGGNWDAAAADCRGEWTVIIGDDDRLLPGFCERLVSAAASDTVVIFSNHYIIDAAGVRLTDESWAWTAAYGRRELPAGRVVDAPRVVWTNSVPMCAALVRTEHLKRLGIKRDLNTPEIELFARLAAEGRRFDFVPDYLMEYRAHAGSATSAGHMTDRLVKYLEPIEVPPSAEAAKRRFMTLLLRAAVDRCLKLGDGARARELVRSAYYPKRLDDPLALAQRFSVGLPETTGPRAYRLARRFESKARQWLQRMHG